MVVKKQCRRCKKVSYSLSAKGSWICPHCGADLSRLPLIMRDASTANILPVSGAKVTGTDLN